MSKKEDLIQIYVSKTARDVLKEFCNNTGFRMSKAAELAILEFVRKSAGSIKITTEPVNG